jgi:nucleotide-binding universal stress UspA family protein
MAIKDILTVVDFVGKQPAVRVAAEVTRRLNAHLTGFTFAFHPMIAVSGFPVGSEDLTASLRRAWENDARKAEAAFREIARLADVPYDSVMEEAPDARFEVLLRRSRLSDLVVIGQEDPERPEPMRTAMIETLLFEGGAPTLVVPFISKDVSLERPLVAWDGSATAARAVRAALPLLAESTAVTVLTVGDRKPEELSDIAVHLSRHGLQVEVKHTISDVAVADTLLNTVSDEGFGYVVMGAYGHSRVREQLFGGATRDILREMTVPVLMTH